MTTPTHPIPYGRQTITAGDLAAVTTVLQGDYLTQGPEIAAFEKDFAAYTGARYAVALANGTAALHLCAMALQVEPGQKVITTPITFAASANCVRYCGGDVVFCDIDPDTYLISIPALRRMLEAAPRGTYAGIIPVDFAGRAVDLEAVRRLADAHGCWIIEDACHAPGGFFTDSTGIRQVCGNGQFADLAIFSFHPVKHIASGEGGMITTNHEALYQRLLQLRTHGITRDAATFTNDMQWAAGNTPETVTTYPGWYMEMQELGYNYRLTDFQAALGRSQLQRAAAGLERRRAIAARYAQAFAGETWLRGQSGSVEGHAYHLYIIEADNRLGLYNHLRQHQVFAQVHYIPVHLMPYYRQQGHRPGDHPMAETYYSRCLSLPMYPALTDAEQEYVIAAVKGFYHG